FSTCLLRADGTRGGHRPEARRSCDAHTVTGVGILLHWASRADVPGATDARAPGRAPGTREPGPMEHATKLDTYGRRHSATEDGAHDAWMSEALEDSLIQRIARLEAALALTAGTVHDVNNVLTVLAGNLFLLTEDLRDQPKLFEQARRARNAAERGSTLLRELLTFSRETDAEPRAISPAEHVRSL